MSYNKINLYSREISEINSRDDIDISVEMFGRKLSVPIFSAPMTDVVDIYSMGCLIEAGVMPVMHRFTSISNQLNIARKYGNNGIYSIGIQFEDMNRFLELYNIGIRNFCIDVANSSSKRVKDFVLSLTKYKDIELMVGNCISKEGVDFYEDILEVKAIRIGVAGGAGCSTKDATGIYRQEYEILQECWQTSKLLIADGGIKTPGDMCKAIACGADGVMMGSVFANTKESPAEIKKAVNGVFKIYRGSASFENQLSYKENPKYIEGKTVYLEHNGETIQDIVNKFSDGLKSCMSYCNARDYKSFRRNVIIVK